MTTSCVEDKAEWAEFDRARRGDESAWRTLVMRHRARLMALAVLITGSNPASEDVVQETFTRALDARIHDSDGTVRGFLGTIAYRLAVKEKRRIRHHTEINETDHIDPNPGPLEGMLLDERNRSVAAAIRSIPEDQREALVLRCYGGHSYEAIAQLLDIPVGTAKSRVFYAVKSCREILKRKGVLE